MPRIGRSCGDRVAAPIGVDVSGFVRRVAELWPRKTPGLPPGQRSLAVFPRFSNNPLRPPPELTGSVELTIRSQDGTEATLGIAELTALGQTEQRSDFHCVTTWTRQDLGWVGVSFLDVWRTLVEPRFGDRAGAPFIVAVGADGHRAVFRREDVLTSGVLLALSLEGQPLGSRHGAPLRLVSPEQYGYKSVKHLMALELHDHQPPSSLGAKEHVRARVALEERHSRLPARLLRVPYRVLIPITVMVSERNAT